MDVIKVENYRGDEAVGRELVLLRAFSLRGVIFGPFARIAVLVLVRGHTSRSRNEVCKISYSKKIQAILRKFYFIFVFQWLQ